MGYPYDILIPAAVLYSNPGITREEFSKILGQIPLLGKFKQLAAMFHRYSYNEGLYGLAEILDLKETENYKKFQKPKTDEHGLEIKPPYFQINNEAIKRGNEFYLKIKNYELELHLENKIEEPKEVEEYAYGKLNINDIWMCPQGSGEKGFVRKIIEEEDVSSPEEKADPLNPYPEYKYKMVISKIIPIRKIHKFSTLEKLVKEFPQFDPDSMYDFSPNEGVFSIDKYNKERFRWFKKDNKYYLDPKTFDLIPATFYLRELGFTDLVMTAEAFKNKAWWLFVSRGREQFEEYIKKFPDSRGKHARAVWDSFTSISAKQQGMTVSDFLRWRMLR